MKRIHKQKQLTLRQPAEVEPEWVRNPKAMTYDDIADLLIRLDQLLADG